MNVIVMVLQAPVGKMMLASLYFLRLATLM